MKDESNNLHRRILSVSNLSRTSESNEANRTDWAWSILSEIVRLQVGFLNQSGRAAETMRRPIADSRTARSNSATLLTLRAQHY